MKKSLFNLLPAALLCSVSISHLSHATGNESSGGGSVIQMPNDQVVLADPFVQRTGQPGQLHEQITQELEAIDQLLYIYTEGRIQLSAREMKTAFFRTQVFHPLVEYRFVEQLPSITACQNVVPLNPGQTGAQVIACTDGYITWILAEPFSRMTVREQAKLIVHERLRNNVTTITHESIADITDGIDVLLQNKSAQNAGGRSPLSEQQVRQIDTMRRRLAQAGLMTLENLQRLNAFANGGGLVEQDPEASLNGFVGVGSVVTGISSLAASSENIDTLCEDCTLKDGASAKGSILRGSTLNQGALAQNAHLGGARIGVATQVFGHQRNMHINGEIGAHSLIVDSAGFFEAGERVRVLRSECNQTCTLTDGSTLEDFTASNGVTVSLGQNATIRNSQIDRIFMIPNSNQHHYHATVSLGDGATISNSTIATTELKLESNAGITDSQLGLYQLKMGRNTRLAGTSIGRVMERSGYFSPNNAALILELADNAEIHRSQIATTSTVTATGELDRRNQGTFFTHRHVVRPNGARMYYLDGFFLTRFRLEEGARIEDMRQLRLDFDLIEKDIALTLGRQASLRNGGDISFDLNLGKKADALNVDISPDAVLDFGGQSRSYSLRVRSDGSLTISSLQDL